MAELRTERFIRNLDDFLDKISKENTLLPHLEKRNEEALIFCKTQSDFSKDFWLSGAPAERKKLIQEYEEMIYDQDSILWKNTDRDVAPLYEKFISSYSRNSKKPPSEYPFKVLKNTPLLVYLRWLKGAIQLNHWSTHYQRIARQLFNDLKECLFENTGFANEHKRYFEQQYGLEEVKEWGNFTPLKTNPGRRPLSRKRFSMIIEVAIKQIQNTKSNGYIEILLYMWLAQASGFCQRRGFSVNDILKISPMDIKSIHISVPQFKLTEGELFSKKELVKKYSVNIGKKRFPISATLRDLLFSYIDGRAKEKSIFSMDYSSYENYLAPLIVELGKDLNQFPPITLETFLEPVKERDYARDDNVRKVPLPEDPDGRPLKSGLYESLFETCKDLNEEFYQEKGPGKSEEFSQ